MSDLIGGLSKLSSTVEKLLIGCDLRVGLLNCRWYLSEIEMFGNEWSIEPSEGWTLENTRWRYVWIPELTEGEPVFDESSRLSKLIVVT